MSFRIQLDQPLAMDVRRIFAEQTSKAVKELQSIEDEIGTYTLDIDAVDEAVHSARKALKKARSVVRLVRDAIGSDAYHSANLACRDAGRLLAGARDSRVMVSTFDDLIDECWDAVDADAAGPIRTALVEQRKECRRKLTEDGERLREAADLIRSAQEGTGDWKLGGGEGFEALQGGLHRTYKRGRKRMDEAYDDPEGVRFHEWRKRTKYHWYHLRLLRQIWPPVMSATADVAHDLASLLGDAHDLDRLSSFLQKHPNLFAAGMHGESLLDKLVLRQGQLYARARPLGEYIFAESPGRFTARIGSYWDVATGQGIGQGFALAIPKTMERQVS